MKKLFLSVAFVAALCMASCSTTSEKSVEQQATEAVEGIKSAATEADAKSIVENAEAYVQKLVSEGKIDEAKKYLDQIAPVVNEKFPALASYIEKAQQVVNTAAAATSAVSDAKEQASDAVDAAKDQASDAVDAAKDAAGNAVDAAKDAASDAVDNAKDAVSNAAQDAANAAANKVNDLLGK